MLGKFKEMMATWKEVLEELKAVSMVHKMDHDLMLREFTKHLERDSHMRWSTFKGLRMVANPHLTKAVVFDE